MFYTFQMKVSLALTGSDTCRFKFLSLPPGTLELVVTLLCMRRHQIISSQIIQMR